MADSVESLLSGSKISGEGERTGRSRSGSSGLDVSAGAPRPLPDRTAVYTGR